MSPPCHHCVTTVPSAGRGVPEPGVGAPRSGTPRRRWGLRRPESRSAVTNPPRPPKEGGPVPPARARWEGRADVTVTGATNPPPHPGSCHRSRGPGGHPWDPPSGTEASSGERTGTGETPPGTEWGQRDSGVPPASSGPPRLIGPPQTHRVPHPHKPTGREMGKRRGDPPGMGATPGREGHQERGTHTGKHGGQWGRRGGH